MYLPSSNGSSATEMSLAMSPVQYFPKPLSLVLKGSATSAGHFSKVSLSLSASPPSRGCAEGPGDGGGSVAPTLVQVLTAQPSVKSHCAQGCF